jgi:hypothetical protein
LVKGSVRRSESLIRHSQVWVVFCFGETLIMSLSKSISAQVVFSSSPRRIAVHNAMTTRSAQSGESIRLGTLAAFSSRVHS